MESQCVTTMINDNDKDEYTAVEKSMRNDNGFTCGGGGATARCTLVVRAYEHT